MTVGILHPGEMGAAVAAALRASGNQVLWASEGRSEATGQRAGSADLEDVRSVAEVARRSDVLVSICPPHAAAELAESVVGFTGTFVDANAISPASARAIAARVESAGATYVDGGIVGPPPRSPGTTRLYLSGSGAADVAAIFAGSKLEAVVMDGPLTGASALKLAFAAWTKGSQALLLAALSLARQEGVGGALVAEWERSRPDLPERARSSAYTVSRKGWRWIGEMKEIAGAMEGAGLPAGFHEASADLFRRVPRRDDIEQDEANVARILGLLARGE